MPYISPWDERRLVELDTKVRVRTTVTAVFLAVTIVMGVVTVIATVAAAMGFSLQPGA